ncbi:MAG: XrtA-associated ATPase [Alphaproteobacteria bacterium]|uniref:XrtA-associated ATPase n=1 Tax=Candidatus Nitrobium versatile TaxID=2884831 RepID=A0A953LZW7_9BACT|nr:XrtA-associated ATPase [Candidatus Nitrobium versatile]
MYESFFNFRTKPFELVPNPDFLYLSKAHKKAVTYLDYGIKEKAGFILLTGEVGSGKTTLIRDLVKKLEGRVTISKVFNTKVSAEQLIALVNEDFGLKTKGKDKVQMLKELNELLIRHYAKGFHSVLIIDEAQNLGPELLEEVRMLSNLETDNAKLLHIILVGQPELRKTISLPELEQLRQRININCHIYPLTRSEAEEYILHRLEVAGNRDAVSFSGETLDIVYHYSRGIPRLLNVICDFILLSAFVEETKELNAEMVRDIIGDLELENKYWEFENTLKGIQGEMAQRAFGEEEKRYYEDMKCLLSSMNLRLDSLEKSATGRDPLAPVEVNKRVDLFEKFMREYMRKTDESLSSLRKNIEELSPAAVTTPSRNGGPRHRKRGFFSRIFGF